MMRNKELMGLRTQTRQGVGWINTVLATALLLLFSSVAGWSYADTGNTSWVNVSQSGPPAQSERCMAYDPVSKRCVMLATGPGGAWGTWTWDGFAWTFSSVACPSDRSFYAMATDTGRGKVVLFGGESSGYLADTWEWDGDTWLRVNTAHAPSARAGASMVYNSSMGKVILFGGSIGGGTVYRDTWVFDGQDWTQLSPSNSPTGRYDFAMSFDSNRRRVVLFGGTTGTGTFYNDTWEWDGTTWTQMAGAGPSARAGTRMVYDESRQSTILFGGFNSSGSYTYFGDTWEWDGTQWQQLQVSLSPSARWRHMMAYDGQRQQTVLFGGVQSGEIKHDTWTFLGDSGQIAFDWTEITAAASWSERADSAAIVFNGRMWLMGGYDGASCLNDVWSSSDGATWAREQANAPWSARSQHSAVVFDGKIWILGGLNGGTLYNDVWYSSDGVTWTEVTTPRPWSARARHEAAVFDGKMWILGGSIGGVAQSNDVWSSPDGVTWTQVTANAAWSPRDHHTCVVSGGKLFLMAGYTVGSGQRNDVWQTLDGATWTQVTPSAAWGPCETPCVLSFRERLWLLTNSGTESQVWSSSDGENWHEIKTTHIWPSPRGAAGAVVFDDQMWTMGGYEDVGKYRNDVWSTEGTVPGKRVYEYRYDALSRLTTVTPNNGVHITYDYDPAGNRLQKHVYSDLRVAVGTANPASHGVANNLGDCPVLQFSLTSEAGDAVELQSLTLVTSGTGNESSAISGAKLWFDADDNGVVSSGDTQLGNTATFAQDNGALVFSAINCSLATGVPAPLLVTYNLSGTASQGQTFLLALATPTDVKAYFVDTGETAVPLGAPINGATLTISTDTDAPTFAGLSSTTGLDGQILLEWAAATDPSAPITYGIWQSTSSFSGAVAGSPTYMTQSTFYTVPGLVNGQEYFFVVRAQDAAGNRETNVMERSSVPEATLYTLTLNAGVHGDFSLPTGVTPFEKGTELTLTGTSDPGYHFTNWTGDVPSAAAAVNPLTVVMYGNKTLSANFARSTGTVAVTPVPADASWSFVDGDGVTHTPGDALTGVPTGEIRLTWMPLPGYIVPAEPAPQVLSEDGYVAFTGVYTPIVTFAAPLESQKKYTGESAQFAVQASGGVGQLHYRWKFTDGQNSETYVGGDIPALTIDQVDFSNAGSYSCEVTDEAEQAYASVVATLAVADALRITVPLIDATRQVGEAYSLSVVTTGGFLPLTYAWSKDGVPLVGVTDGSMVFHALELNDSGNYSLEISDSHTAKVSTQTVLTVAQELPVLGLVGLGLLVGGLAAAGGVVRKRRH